MHVKNVQSAITQRHDRHVDEGDQSQQTILDQQRDQHGQCAEENRIAGQVADKKGQFQPHQADKGGHDDGKKRVLVLGPMAEKKIVAVDPPLDMIEDLGAVKTRIMSEVSVRPGHGIGREQEAQQESGPIHQRAELLAGPFAPRGRGKATVRRRGGWIRQTRINCAPRRRAHRVRRHGFILSG